MVEPKSQGASLVGPSSVLSTSSLHPSAPHLPITEGQGTLPGAFQTSQTQPVLWGADAPAVCRETLSGQPYLGQDLVTDAREGASVTKT